MNPLEQENRSLKRTLHLLISKAERNRDILQTFQEIELRLLSCDSLADLLDMLLITVKEYFRLDAVNLTLFDPEHTARDLIPQYEAPAADSLYFADRYGELKQLYRKSPKPWLGAPDKELRTRLFPRNNRISSCALLPLVRQEVIIGSLHLGSNDISRYTPNVATDYISHLASVVSVCVENCISQETLRRLSIIDMLTKVNNRRSFDQELQRELSRASRNHYPLSCLFIDLDHFKQINDTHGHQTGDQVLRQTAQTIAEQLRKTDLIARYGGEEFAVLLPGCVGQQALEVAESIRQRVSAVTLHSEAGTPLQVTLSIGVSTCPPQPHEPGIGETMAKRLVACADKGVYQAKRDGRNRVAFIPIGESGGMTELAANASA
ncbi:sensor domain-containing diguanylate cyclase [Motiliproteus sediminis]|uniref:sensor domain-containing diguanylate cyclase n=1 Tax=Motiliproteus sediminis TaxID=1468178 RepID=UPI001AEF6EB4|nr:sensor domain-containing diguanylate cyclase [Motiliproteus sediminis]